MDRLKPNTLPIALFCAIGAVACGHSKKTDSNAPDPKTDSQVDGLNLTEKNVKISSLTTTDDGRPAWIQSDSEHLYLMVDGKRLLAVETTDSQVLARSIRPDAKGIVELQVSDNGSLRFTTFGLKGDVDTIDIAGMTSKVWDDQDQRKSFDELCKQKEPILRTPQEFASMSRFSLATNRDESKWVLLISTCGYVDIAVIDPKVGLIDRKTLFEPKYDSEVIRFFLAISSELRPSNGDELATVMIEDDPSDYQKDSKDKKTYRVVSLSDTGNTEKSTVFAIEDNQQVFSFAADLEKIALVGTQSKPVNGRSNDSSEDDAWIVLVDRESGRKQASHTLHLKRDDFYRAVSFSDSGQIYVTGDTDRHHVDTGSWDGGSQVLLARYSGNLELQETIAFGQDRMDTGLEIVVGNEVFVSGSFDRIPNNHLPKEENWYRSFVLSLPLEGWEAP